MEKKEKIFTYSNKDSYVVCFCEISDILLDYFRRMLKKRVNFSTDILHKFDNMLGSGEVINLDFLINELLTDNIEVVSEVATCFLDILDVKEYKKVSFDEFSQTWKNIQVGLFTMNSENAKYVKEYTSSASNDKVMNIIGYDLDARINEPSKANKRKILSFNSISA